MSRFFPSYPLKRSILLKALWIFIPLCFLLHAPNAHADHRSTLSTGLTTSGTYTDNPTDSGNNKGSDFYSEFAPWLHYDLAGKHTGLGLSYDPTLRYYFKEEDTFIGHNLGLDAHWQIQKHLTTSFSNSFQVSEDPYDAREPVFTRTDEEPVFEDPTLRTGRRTYTSNNMSQSFLYQFGSASLLNFDYSFGFLNNDDPTLEDNLHHGPDFQVTHWWNEKYGTEFSGSYTRGEYSSDSPSVNEYTANARVIRKMSPTLNLFLEHGQTYVRYGQQVQDTDLNTADAQGSADYQVFDGNVGMDYHLSQTIFMTLTGGYFYEEAERGDPISGFQINGDMARQFQKGSIRLTGGTGTEQNFFGAENLGFTRYYRGQVAGQYLFTRRCSGISSLQYQLNKYEAENRDDTTYTWITGINYLIRPWLNANVSYTYRMVDSTDSAENYTENRISISLSFTPKNPFRLD